MNTNTKDQMRSKFDEWVKSSPKTIPEWQIEIMWDEFQKTPMTYSLEPRRSILCDAAIEAGAKALVENYNRNEKSEEETVKAIFNAMEAEQPNFVQESQWMPIDTAPKDEGTPILAWDSDYEQFYVIIWNEVHQGWDETFDCQGVWPTHWMPFLAPPK